MARIDFNWSEPTLNSYDHIDANDFRTALPANLKAEGKPLMVFITSSSDEDKIEMQNIESSVFKDESISIGSTMFRAIKVKGSTVKEGHPFWKTLSGKDLPRMIIVDANGQKVGMCEGKQVSSSKIFAFMKKAAARTYKTDLETIVKETKTILTEIDQVEAKRAALATRKGASKNDAPDRWVKDEKELDAAKKTIETREASLKKKWDERVTKA
jgi:hypothetical protein